MDYNCDCILCLNRKFFEFNYISTRCSFCGRHTRVFSYTPECQFCASDLPLIEHDIKQCKKCKKYTVIDAYNSKCYYCEDV